MTDIRLPRELTPSTIATLRGDVDRAMRSDETVVLRGEGEVFCHGLGLTSLTEPEDIRANAVHAFAELLLALRFGSSPVFAVVEGEARGGGVGLAAAADWVLALPQATFSLPEMALGMLPATIVPLLRERLTVASTRHLALSTSPILGEQALRLGLVDALASPEGLERVLSRRLREFCRARPTAVGRWKKMCASAQLEEDIRAGADITAADIVDPDIVDPILAYLDEGVPPWSRR